MASIPFYAKYVLGLGEMEREKAVIVPNIRPIAGHPRLPYTRGAKTKEPKIPTR
ncbi:hypothetical protein HKBW3S25_01246, partial [Candidatus Hakubella thermalkaliphila]